MGARPDHHFTSELRWAGSTRGGYEAYDRAHEIRSTPDGSAVGVSSAPGFGGDPALLNPEVMLLMAASSCQLLTFLATAAASRVDVVAYEDRAEALLPGEGRPMRMGRAVLRPRITVAPGTDEARVHRLVEKAHAGCIVANSIGFPVQVEAEVLVADGAAA
jgi:organic hydroperoxide reductase OsmC/OhrA